MADAHKTIIRLSWREWQASRAKKRSALAARGLTAPCRRKTARPETLAAADVKSAIFPRKMP
jgi:hypothetical protein